MGQLAQAGKQESIKPGDGISIESSESGVWVAAVVPFLPVVSGYQSIWGERARGADPVRVKRHYAPPLQCCDAVQLNQAGNMSKVGIQFCPTGSKNRILQSTCFSNTDSEVPIFQYFIQKTIVAH